MPAAPSPAQSDASRLNGAMSHGPVTDEGKATSSLNATRHGICSARLELDGAAAEHMAWHLQLILSDWSPETEYEQRLVHDLAVISLKLARLDTLELKALDAAIEGSEVRYPSLASLARYRRALRREQDEVTSSLSHVQEDRYAREDAAEAAELVVGEAELAEAEAELAAAKVRMNEPELREPTTGPTHGLGAATLMRAGVDIANDRWTTEPQPVAGSPRS